MGEKLLLFLALFSLINGLTMGDWNILKYQREKTNLDGSRLKNYCESWRINVELNNIRGFEVVPQECIDYIGKYMTSTQYKSDSERAIEECQLYLSECCSLKGNNGKDAWIFDVDDTLLSTVPYFKKHGFGGLDDEYKKIKNYKAEARKKLMEEGYRILGIIGDQWSSFEGSPYAKRTFKLPNSLYYVS